MPIILIRMHLMSERLYFNSRRLRRNDETYGIVQIYNQCVWKTPPTISHLIQSTTQKIDKLEIQTESITLILLAYIFRLF